MYFKFLVFFLQYLNLNITSNIQSEARVPISASAISQLLVNVGVDRVVTIDLHCGQIQGFFRNTPVNNILPSSEFAHYLMEKNFKKEELAIVAPDAGAVERARRLADRVHADRVVTILKRRVQAGKIDSMHIAGDVKGMVCVIVDDMTDTSGTLCKAAEVLKNHGASQVCKSLHILRQCHRIFYFAKLTPRAQSLISRQAD